MRRNRTWTIILLVLGTLLIAVLDFGAGNGPSPIPAVTRITVEVTRILPADTPISTPKPVVITPDNVDQLQVLARFEVRPLYALAISPVEPLLAIAGRSSIRIYDMDRFAYMSTSLSGIFFADDIAWSPDGNQLLVGMMGSAEVWNLANGEKIHDLSYPDEDYIYEVCWSTDGDKLVVAFRRAILIWDAYTGQLLNAINAWGPKSISPDCQYVAEYGVGVDIWDLTRGTSNRLIGGSISGLTWSLDNSRLAIRIYTDFDLVRNVSNTYTFVKLGWASRRSIGLAWSPDGQWLVTNTRDGTLYFWDPITGGILKEIPGLVDYGGGLEWLWDGTRIVMSSWMGEIVIFGIPEG